MNVHNNAQYRQWMNLRHLDSALGEGVENLLEAVSFKEAMKSA